jgi:hypothetical protein
MSVNAKIQSRSLFLEKIIFQDVSCVNINLYKQKEKQLCSLTSPFIYKNLVNYSQVEGTHRCKLFFCTHKLLSPFCVVGILPSLHKNFLNCVFQEVGMSDVSFQTRHQINTLIITTKGS